MNNRDYQKMDETELKAYMHELLGAGCPGSDIVGGYTSSDGRGCATGNHLIPICVSFRVIELGWKRQGMKATTLEFIAEFVKNEYSAQVLSFLLGAYKGKELSKKDWAEINTAFAAAIAPFSNAP